MKTWSRHRWLVLTFVATWLFTGCMQGARLVQETEKGGIAVYPYVPERGAMTSSFRGEAMRLIDRRCGGRYRIVREGETKGRDRVSTVVPGAEEVVHDHRWGIQFECR